MAAQRVSPRSERRASQLMKSPPAAAAVVVIALVVAWTAYQVSLRDALLFVGYEVAFIIVPGVVVFIALSGRIELGLRQIALGWALGYALEIGAFILTAATGT